MKFNLPLSALVMVFEDEEADEMVDERVDDFMVAEEDEMLCRQNESTSEWNGRAHAEKIET